MGNCVHSMRSEVYEICSVLLKTTVTEWMSVDCISPSIFEQPTLESTTTFDVDFSLSAPASVLDV